MAKYDSKSLRNVAFVGHGGTGKTSLCESLLFVSGKSERLGRVDEGTSSMDFEPEEQKRRISISAAVNFCNWEKHKINIVDTPGDSNFAYDTKSCLRIIDGVIVVIDAVSGVEFQTEVVWEYADEFNLPRFVFINRTDRERADFYKAVASVKDRLGKKVTPFFLPIGKEDKFNGLIDLIAMKALVFDDLKGTFKTTDIPADLQSDAEEYRETLMEDIAESDEVLMDKYLDSGELTAEEIELGIRKGVLSGSLIPVICGSASKNIGITPLMNLILAGMPSPVDRGAAIGKHPTSSEKE
ncbi:MAG: GTP-binding protein, partial [Smithellaceae bacterium]|nr:GTP-binding protein [Smithellaceae bacterium]